MTQCYKFYDFESWLDFLVCSEEELNRTPGIAFNISTSLSEEPYFNEVYLIFIKTERL